MRNLLLLPLLLLLLACESNGKKRVDREKLRFKITDDAVLYFRNTRLLNYDYQNLQAAKLDIYRHEDRSQQADYPLLIPALVLNWRHNEAYIVLESNESLGEVRPLIVEWRDSLQQQEGKYVLESNNKMEQLQFAAQLYEGMQNGQRFYLPSDSSTTRQPFLNHPIDRRVFRTTLYDYYRLTRNIR